jgi:hypothetical protein
MGEGDLGVAGVRGDSEGVVIVEKGESSLVDVDVDSLGESGKEIGLLGMMRGGRRGRLCTGLNSSLIFLPRSIITIG